MANGNNDFEVNSFNFIGQIVELGLALRLDDRLVKIEESVSGVSNFG